MAKHYDSLLRLLLVGDAGVGKTCMICQYANHEFHTSHITTLGVDFKMKVITVDGRRVKLQIWDTAGQERFESITKQFYTRAQGCILVFDINSRKSFDSIAKWLLYVRQYAKDSTSVILVGNKSDVEDSRRQVSRETAQSFANYNNIKYYETSAKDPNTLEMPFTDICRSIMKADKLAVEKSMEPVVLSMSGSQSNLSTQNKNEKTGASIQTEEVKHVGGCSC